MEHLSSPEHQAVRSWLDDSARRLNEEGLKQLENVLAGEVASTVKRYHESDRALRLGHPGYQGSISQRAQTHQYLQLARPVLRWIRLYRMHLRLGHPIQKPYALGEFLLSKALGEAPQSLWKPLGSDEAWSVRFAARAVTAHQQELARQLIENHPTLFSPMPAVSGKLPDEYTIRAKAAREKIVSERMQVINKVKKAGILTPDEMRILLSMV